MGKCISKCFMIYQTKKSINTQHTARTETSLRLEMQEVNMENEVRFYFPFYQGNKSIQWKDVMEVLQKELHKSKDSNNKLSNEYLIEILSKYEKYYFRQDDILELLNIVVKILKKQAPLSKVQLNSSSENGAIESKKSIQSIAKKLYHLQQSLIKYHKASIQHLKFIYHHHQQQQKKTQKHHYKEQCHNVCWNQFKFDFNEKQIQTVASSVRPLVQNDLRATAFLRLHFQVAISKKCQQVKYKKLEKLYLSDLQNLAKKYPGNDVLLLDYIPSKCKITQVTNREIDPLILTFQSTSTSSHYDQLTQFLLQKKIESKKDESLLMQMLRDKCLQQVCKVEIIQCMKVCQQGEVSNVLFNEKIFDLLYDKVDIKEKLQDLKEEINGKKLKQQKSLKLSIQQIITIENQEVDRFLKKVLQSEQKLELNMSKVIMMKVKCLFNQMQPLIEATNKLIIWMENNGCEVIEMKNNLNYLTKDCMLTVKLPNSIISIAMVLTLQSISNQFHQQFMSLCNNNQYKQFFPPLSLLFRLRKSQSTNFFTQLYERYENMTENLDQSNDAQQISELNKQMDSFQTKYLKPLGINTQRRHHEILQDISSIIVLLKEIKACTIKKNEQKKSKQHLSQHMSDSQLREQKVNQIILSFVMKDCNKAKQLLQNLEKEYIQENKLLLEIKGDIEKENCEYNLSLPHYLNCQKRYQYQDKTDTIEYYRLLDKIATNYQLNENYKSALETFEEQLLVKEKIHGSGSQQCAQTLYSIGLLYEKQERYEDSAKFYKLALQIYAQTFNERSLQYGKILESLGSISQLRKRHQRAIENLEKCFRIYEVFYGKQSLSCAQIFNKLGQSYLFKADYERSFECFFKSLEIKQRIYGRNTVNCASTLSAIGSVHEKMDEFDEATKYYKRALQIIQTTYGKKSIQCVRYLNNMIVAFYHQQKYQQALAYGLRCLNIQQQQKGKGSIDCSGTLFGLSLAYEKLGLKHEAYAVCRRAYRIRRSLLGEEHSLTQQAMNRGEYLLQRQNQNCLRDVFIF